MKRICLSSDLEILIPDNYVSSTTERLQLYSTLDNLKNEVELESFKENLKDRFGPYPASVDELINTVRLRWLGEELGFEKINLKNEKLRAYFISGKDDYFKSDVFGKILVFVQGHPKRCRMKDSVGKFILTIEEIKTVGESIQLLNAMKILS